MSTNWSNEQKKLKQQARNCNRRHPHHWRRNTLWPDERQQRQLYRLPSHKYRYPVDGGARYRRR